MGNRRNLQRALVALSKMGDLAGIVVATVGDSASMKDLGCLRVKGMALAVTLFPFVAFAENPPTPAEFIQDKAPEAITIRVHKVTSNRMNIVPLRVGDKSFDVVYATVISVSRTESRLKIGDEIIISYLYEPSDDHTTEQAPLPKLGKGNDYLAWLTKTEKGHFEPAARGFSFSDFK